MATKLRNNYGCGLAIRDDIEKLSERKKEQTNFVLSMGFLDIKRHKFSFTFVFLS
jgi:hypothetical protein